MQAVLSRLLTSCKFQVSYRKREREILSSVCKPIIEWVRASIYSKRNCVPEPDDSDDAQPVVTEKIYQDCYTENVPKLDDSKITIGRVMFLVQCTSSHCTLEL